MIKIPSGISSFAELRDENYFYADKTKYIEVLESYGEKYIFFLRPRRFGKTLFLSTLENYYDLNKKEELLYTFLVKVQKAIEIFINKYNLNLKCPESHDPASMLNLY